MDKTICLSPTTTAIIEDDGSVQLHTDCGGPGHDETLVLILGEIRRQVYERIAASDPPGFAILASQMCERLGLAATIELQLQELMSIDPESAQRILSDYEEALRAVAQVVSDLWSKVNELMADRTSLN